MSGPVAYPIAANGALYDPAQVEEYFTMLFRHVDWREGECISLLGIGEKGTEQEGVFKDREFVPPAFIGVSHRHLKRWAEHHVAGFVVPAVLLAGREGKAGGLDKVAALTAIILDLDSGDVSAKLKFATERLGEPTMVVASGGKTEDGKYKAHVYWRFSEPSEEVERVAALRKMLAAKVGGDQSFGRATQVVRVPGSVHAKNGNATVCKILDRKDGDYDLEDLADIIENMLPMPGLPPVEKPGQSLALSAGGFDFTPNPNTAVAALHRDIHEGGDDLNRWGEFSKVAGFNIAELRAGRLTPEAAYQATSGWVLSHMVPPWPQQRIDQEFRALVNLDVAANGDFPQSLAARASAVATTTISPNPATWPLASAIPPRQWLFGRWFMRGIVTAVIAPGGIGKSSLMASVTLSMASGKPFLGKDIYNGPLRTWYWNLEDGADNLARSRIAASVHHGISEEACGGRMFVDSGPEGATLCTAIEDRNGFTIIAPVFENIVAAIDAQEIDALIIDPFVSSHAINENDNNKVDANVKAWARVAASTKKKCSITLVHHSVKMKGETVTADSARGAGALNNAARMTLVLNRMTVDQADAWGIDPNTAQSYFSVADDKHNMSAPEQADWFKIVSQSLNNGDATYEADSIGVVERWHPPRMMDGVDASDLFKIQKVLSVGTYWKSPQAKDGGGWAGGVVAEQLRLDVDDAKVRLRIGRIMDVWLKNGMLATEMARNSNSKLKERVIVGHWAGDPNAFKEAEDD